MKTAYPIHNLGLFINADKKAGIYVNTLRDHIRRHRFILTPHRHDFFTVILCTTGSGVHLIDFNAYKILPGSLFFLTPGQVHQWNFDKKFEGHVLFHSRDFYEVNYTNKKINDYPFFYCRYNTPVIYLDGNGLEKVKDYFREMIREFEGAELAKNSKICSLLDLVYIQATRNYLVDGGKIIPGTPHAPRIRELEQLIDKNFLTLRSASEYAKMMGISAKQLNRICRETLNKTTTTLIHERIILEAKRRLVQDDRQIADIAAELGWYDAAYFTRFFKKETNETPHEFRKRNITLDMPMRTLPPREFYSGQEVLEKNGSLPGVNSK